MPETDVLFYCDADGSAPVLEWLDELRRKDRRAFKKCEAAIELLAMRGYELRRPLADLLENGIYELRARVGRVNYRILYFFHGRNIAVLAHGLTKERAIPPTDLNQAIERKRQFEANPDKHTYRE
ncbi:MAG TPA: type II toxin-antitoxin system RelE/ParE family toxin [Phycisphaerae bacterium]|nr:type II toxin-antitoxin system RelE/ParE family toxin [Phycisphaerae bacterium]